MDLDCYGVSCFYFQTKDQEETITSKTHPLFGKSKTKLETVTKKVKETNDELWNRINEYIKKSNLEVVNIESIYRCFICTGSHCSGGYIHNDTPIGYRIFYRQRINNYPIN